MIRRKTTIAILLSTAMFSIVPAAAQSVPPAPATAAAETPHDRLEVTLEAVVGFASREKRDKREKGGPPAKVAAPARTVPAQRALDITANDRRFLRSLRIAADETTEVDN